MKQLTLTNQNSKEKVLRSEKWNLSSSDIIFPNVPSTLSACLSSIHKPTADPKETKQIMKPTRSAVPKPPDSQTIGTTIPFMVEPNLETLKLNPKAKASSLPLNHFDMMAD